MNKISASIKQSPFRKQYSVGILVPRPAIARSRVVTRAGELERSRHQGEGFMGGFGQRWQKLADYIDRMDDEFSLSFESFMPALGTEGMKVAMDVMEDDKTYSISADLPGLQKEDVSIVVTPDRMLTLSGERLCEKEYEGKKWRRSEKRYGRFCKNFHLPKNADAENISAKSVNGVIMITIPKTAVKQEEGKFIRIE